MKKLAILIVSIWITQVANCKISNQIKYAGQNAAAKTNYIYALKIKQLTSDSICKVMLDDEKYNLPNDKRIRIRSVKKVEKALRKCAKPNCCK